MSGSQPAPPAPACSVLSALAGESAFGSAASARCWVGIEQVGPWGRQAATQSHLDPVLGGRLDRAVTAVGGRLVLLRAPGAHPDDHHDAPRTVLVASCAPGREWLLRGSLTSPSDLDRLDLTALADGEQGAVVRSLPALAATAEPHLLVCTNGRRDLCCAVRGRPVALGAAAVRPGRVWETSHTGGHRFAPTGVLLPSGATLARLDVDLAVQALDAAADRRLPTSVLGPVHDRGASGLPPAQRVAVSAVREAAAVTGLGDLTAGDPVVVGDGQWRVAVRHRDGRSWTTTVTTGERGPDRPESCLKPAVPQVAWSAAVTDDGAG